MWAALANVLKGGGKAAASGAAKGAAKSAASGAARSAMQSMGGPNQMGANISKWTKGAQAASNVQKSQAVGNLGGMASGVGSPNTSSAKSTDSKGFGDSGLGGTVKGLFEKYSLAHGVAQAISGAVKKKRAKSMIPTYATAPERALFGEVQRMRRASQTNQPWYQTAAANIEESTGANRAFKMGGRGALSALNANLQAQKAQISQQAAANAANLIPMESDMARYGGNISRDASMLQTAMDSAEAAALQSGGMQNILATIGSNYKKKKK